MGNSLKIQEIDFKAVDEKGLMELLLSVDRPITDLPELQYRLTQNEARLWLITIEGKAHGLIATMIKRRWEFTSCALTYFASIKTRLWFGEFIEKMVEIFSRKATRIEFPLSRNWGRVLERLWGFETLETIYSRRI